MIIRVLMLAGLAAIGWLVFLAFGDPRVDEENSGYTLWRLAWRDQPGLE